MLHLLEDRVPRVYCIHWYGVIATGGETGTESFVEKGSIGYREWGMEEDCGGSMVGLAV